MTAKEVMDYFLAISIGMNGGEAMRILEALPIGANSAKIVAACIGASMNVKKQVNASVKAMNLTLQPSMMINDEISMTFFALTGHVMMLIPNENLTEYGKAVKASYQSKIGGVENIQKFSAGVVMEGKEKRAEILLKWSKSLAGFDVTPHIDMFARLAPDIVMHKTNAFYRFFSGLWYYTTLPFRIAFRILYWVVTNLWALFWKIIRYSFISFIIRVLAAALIPNISMVLVNWIAAEPVSIAASGPIEAMVQAAVSHPVVIQDFAMASAYLSWHVLASAVKAVFWTDGVFHTLGYVISLFFTKPFSDVMDDFASYDLAAAISSKVMATSDFFSSEARFFFTMIYWSDVKEEIALDFGSIAEAFREAANLDIMRLNGDTAAEAFAGEVPGVAEKTVSVPESDSMEKQDSEYEEL